MAIRLSLVALQQWHVMPAAASPCLSCRSLPTSAVWWASWWQRWRLPVLKCLANLHMASTVEYNENNSPRWWMMIELYWVGFHGTSRNRAWLKKQSYFVQIPLSNTTSIPRQQNLWIFLDWFNWFWGSDAEFDPLGFSDTFDIKWLREILGAESRECREAFLGIPECQRESPKKHKQCIAMWDSISKAKLDLNWKFWRIMVQYMIWNYKMIWTGRGRRFIQIP